MACKTLQGRYAERLEVERNKLNEKIETLYKKLDALDSIIDQQALEISQLKEQKKQAIEYINKNKYENTFRLVGNEETGKMESLNGELLDLLAILGDKEWKKKN